jgi:hypothetical protein
MKLGSATPELAPTVIESPSGMIFIAAEKATGGKSASARRAVKTGLIMRAFLKTQDAVRIIWLPGQEKQLFVKLWPQALFGGVDMIRLAACNRLTIPDSPAK